MIVQPSVDSTSVVKAIDDATLTDAGTPAATDQVMIKDAGTGELQTADFSEFGGGGSAGSAAGHIHQLYPVGKFFGAATLIGDDFDGGAENLSNLNGYTAFYPFVLPFDVDVDAFALDLYTANVGEDRKSAIFLGDNTGTTNYPGTALANAIATIDGSATGFIIGLLPATISLSANTLYWVGHSGSANGMAARAATQPTSSWAPVYTTVSDHNNVMVSSMRKNTSGTHATFPTSVEDMDFTSGTTEDQNNVATLFLRRA